MALFRDEKEALRRLEEALQEEECDEDPEEAYDGEEYDEYEEDSEECDGEEEYDGDDGYIEGFAPDVSHIRIRNTDRTDLTPEDLTERLHKSEKRRTAAVVIALLTIAAVFCALIWFVLRYM